MRYLEAAARVRCILLLIILNTGLVDPSAATDLYVYKGAGCTGVGRLKQFDDFVGTPSQGVVDFTANRTWADMLNSTTWLTSCWKTTGRSLSLSIPMLPQDLGTSMSEGALGRYDGYYRELGRRIVAGGFPGASIRVGWEFNGNWYRWGAGQTSAEQFKTYYRHIVEALRTVPGQSFRMVWNPTLGIANIRLEDYYPGDDVVDIVGMDVYNQSWRPDDTDFNVRWRYFLGQPYGLNWLATFSSEHRKVIALPEWGTGTRKDGHGFGDDPKFVEAMAEWIRQHNVAFHGYWDYAALDYSAELSNGSNPKAGSVFKASFGQH